MRETPADVCLVSEAAYPFVTGGLSSWAHQIVSGLPDLTFDLVSLVAGRTDRPHAYDLPPNVRALHVLDLHGANRAGRHALPGPDGGFWPSARAFAESDDESRDAAFDRLVSSLAGATPAIPDLVRSDAGWSLLVADYRRRARSQSFVDYVWTWRSVLTPALAAVAARLPAAHVYHAASTGFAGFIAALAGQRAGAPFVLTEHGNYSREREVELARADWIRSVGDEGVSLLPREQFFKEWWASFFDLLARHAYRHAHDILTLNDVGRDSQIEAGAPADRIRRVPNGVDIASFRGLRHEHDWSARPFRVGFVGRVVPVKDCKTLLRAVSIARREIDRLEVLLIGPTDEVPEYHAECLDLVEQLGIGDIVRFTGPGDVRDYLGKLDLVVLTSLTEAQPLVLLEAFAAGVPAVCSDVGGCRELIEGSSLEADRSLGPCGMLTRPAMPARTAAALVAVWKDPALHARFREAAIARAGRYYDERALLAAYREIYTAHPGVRSRRGKELGE